MVNVLVYSCVVGGYDDLSKSLFASETIPEANVRYVLFTDKPGAGGNIVMPSGVAWEIKPLLWKHAFCNRRTARWHKINSHKLQQAFDVSIWIDGSQRIKNIQLSSALFEATLQKKPSLDIFSFKHPQRSCIYQELQACLGLKKDNPELMKAQIAAYRAQDYPPFNGLVETACVIRRASENVARFNSLWWQQISNHSLRDQLSFNYVAWKSAIPYGHIPGSRAYSPFFDFIPH